MNRVTRLPAVPLITHDPMFSIWSNTDVPTGEDTTHWTGIKKKLRGVITVDGVRYRFLGRPTCQTMPMIASSVTPLSTRFTFAAAGVELLLRCGVSQTDPGSGGLQRHRRWKEPVLEVQPAGSCADSEKACEPGYGQGIGIIQKAPAKIAGAFFIARLFCQVS